MAKIEIGDPIPSKDIVRIYRDRFSIDVSRLVPDGSIHLEEVAPYGYYMFRPVIAGDSQFYSDLMDRIGYDDGEKAEFQAAKHYVSAGQSVLDVGCGPGRFSAYCRGSYKGIELNPQAVADAKRNGRNVVLERLEDQAENAFDVVTLFQVLEHVSDPQAFLADAARRVAPGGRLIVTTPDMDGYMANSPNHVLNYPPHHISWWTADAIAALMAENGFGNPVVWKEPLQSIHVTDWLEATVAPRGHRHFDFSLKTRLIRQALRVGSRVLGPLLRRGSHVTGQCVMVVGERIG
jgi:SAM-dependent methyltransferase